MKQTEGRDGVLENVQKLVEKKKGFGKFGSHRHRGSVYIMVLVCHVFSQDHIYYMAMRLYGKKSFKVSHHLAKCCGHRHCGSRDMFLVCQVNSQDCMIIWSCGFMGGSCSRFVVMSIVVVEI